MPKKLTGNEKANFLRGTYKKGKIKCLICGCWYWQVGSHIFQRHNMTAKEYRELYNLPLRRGIQPDWLRKIRRENALKHKTYKNNLIKKGQVTRYKKEDERAKKGYYWAGKRTQLKKIKNEYYN